MLHFAILLQVHFDPILCIFIAQVHRICIFGHQSIEHVDEVMVIRVVLLDFFLQFDLMRNIVQSVLKRRHLISRDILKVFDPCGEFGDLWADLVYFRQLWFRLWVINLSFDRFNGILLDIPEIKHLPMMVIFSRCHVLIFDLRRHGLQSFTKLLDLFFRDSKERLRLIEHVSVVSKKLM